MTIQLGSIVLRDGMVWEEEFSYTGIAQEIKTTLGGVPLVFTAPVLGPMELTLSSLPDQGWQTYATLKSLQSLAQTIGGQFSLIWGAKTYTVGFRHTDPPVLQATPIIPRSSYADTDYFQVSIKLIAYTAT